MTKMHLSKGFMNTSTVQESVEINRLLGDGHHGWKWFWDFQWHFIPRALINWVSNILKSFGYISAKLTNEKKPNNPCIETACWSKYVQQIASLNVLKPTNSVHLKLTIILICVRKLHTILTYRLNAKQKNAKVWCWNEKKHWHKFFVPFRKMRHKPTPWRKVHLNFNFRIKWNF